jgi:hypothetical protein
VCVCVYIYIYADQLKLYSRGTLVYIDQVVTLHSDSRRKKSTVVPAQVNISPSLKYETYSV